LAYIGMGWSGVKDMSGKSIEMQSLSQAEKSAARDRVERPRNWTHLSVFLILTLAMMAALAGLGVLLFLLVDQIISLFG
jgi:uncharacterized membrane protein